METRVIATLLKLKALYKPANILAGYCAELNSV